MSAAAFLVVVGEMETNKLEKRIKELEAEKGNEEEVNNW